MLLILADDLTGALDTGIQFAKHAISTGVLPSAAAPLFQSSPPEVLVIHTNTRHCSPAEARAVVAACARQDAVYVYKKTDSTLRGHIGAELEALMDARGVRQLPFVPAYPALGRTTVGGRQYLRGKPIEETEMAADPLNPVKTSYIPAIIGAESDVPVRLIGRGAQIPSGEREILVFDGQTDDDLRNIARRLYEKNLLGESAGCAGFAEALMEVLPFERNREAVSAKTQNRKHPGKRPPVLILSGSLHPVSREQVRAALDYGVQSCAVAGQKLLLGWIESAQAEALAAACVRALKCQGACILGTEMALGSCTLESLPHDRRAQSVSGCLGGLVRMIAGQTESLVLVVFGGDTLLGVIESMEYTYMRPLEEIRPGVVLSDAKGPAGTAVVVTKAGAFGERDIIPVIMNHFR